MVVEVLNIGVGTLLLVIIWLFAVMGVVSLAAVPKARLGIPVVLLVSLAISLVFLFYPRQSPDQEATPSDKVIDEVFFGRLVLLLSLCVCVVGGCVAVIVLHFMKPISADQSTLHNFMTS